MRLTEMQELQAENYHDESNHVQVTVGAVGLEEWHSVTVTWNGGTTSNGLSLYVDGIAKNAVNSVTHKLWERRSCLRR